MKQILLPRGEIPRMAKTLGVSHPTVISALKFVTKTELAERIRQLALAKGGQIYEQPKIKQL